MLGDRFRLGTLDIDLSRPPNEKERKSLSTRLNRLRKAEMSIAEATYQMRRLAGRDQVTGKDRMTEVRIRSGFIRLDVPAGPDPADRKAPAPEHRPPATRLISPNGIALPFYLIALFEAQSRTPPGEQPGNLTPIRGTNVIPGWTSYIATSAEPSYKGKNLIGVLDKKQQQVQKTLNRLASKEEALVHLPKAAQKQGRHEGFALMLEDARPGIATNAFYTVPEDDEDYFVVPTTLFTNSWIFVLEDSELALLLLMARLRHMHGDGLHRLSAGVRQNLYGIGRDSFEAHKMLERLDLADVISDRARSLDSSKVKDYATRGALPHELRFLPEGLDHPAYTALVVELEHQLSR